MKKQISNILRLFLIMILAGLTASCSFWSNSIEEHEESPEACVSADSADSSWTFSVNGKISIKEGAFPSSILNTSKGKRSSRSAVPGIPSTLTYSVTASDGTNEVAGTKTDPDDPTNTGYELVLEGGKNWTVSVIVKDDYDMPVYSDTWPIPASNTQTNLSHNFYVKPVASNGGTGVLDLTIVLNNDLKDIVTKVTAVCKSVDNMFNWEASPSPSEDITFSGNENKSISVYDDTIASGQYEVSFNFYNDLGGLVYNTVQTINVFDNLTTNTWVSGGGSGPIKSNGTFELTKELIDGYAKTHLYVGNTHFTENTKTDDINGTGTAAKPFESVTGAINYLKKVGSDQQDYTIFVVGTLDGGQEIADTDSPTQITIPAKSITLVGFSGIDNSTHQPKDEIKSTDATNTLSISTTIPVTVKDLKITKGTGTSHGLNVAENSKIYLEGTPVINDLYLEDYWGEIYLSDNLYEGTSITITPQDYDEPSYDVSWEEINTKQYVDIKEDSGINISDNNSYFHITPDPDNPETIYFINQEGCISKYCTITFESPQTSQSFTKTVVFGQPVGEPEGTLNEYAGYTFAGWFTAIDEGATLIKRVSSEDLVLEDNLKLYAKWSQPITNLYVNTGEDGSDDHTGAEGSPLKTIATAINKIKDWSVETDYTIQVSGMSSEAFITLDENIIATSITIQGTNNEQDGFKGPEDSSNSSYSDFSIETSVPVLFKNFKITGRFKNRCRWNFNLCRFWLKYYAF